MADSTSVKEYRLEQLRGGQWEHCLNHYTDWQWQAIDYCHQLQYHGQRFPTRVFEVATGLVPYYLNEQGQRDYSQELHETTPGCPELAPITVRSNSPSNVESECIDCGSTLHRTGQYHCPEVNKTDR